MKKTLLAALIAATALVPPAFAQDRGGRWGGDRSASPAQRAPQQRNWNRPAPSAQQPARPERQSAGGNRGGWTRPDAQPQGQPRQQQRYGSGPESNARQPARAERQSNGGDRSGWNRADGRPQGQAGAQQSRSSDDRGSRGQWNSGDRRQGLAAPQQVRGGDRNGRFDRNDRNRFDSGNPGWNGSRRAGGWSSGNVYTGDRRGRWDNGWRNDRRYDWRGYRTQNRSLYRLPRYYAPSGWGYGYRRFSIGFQLSSLLYASNYWINDPFSYRLPEVDGPYRWVRYYNDALLVDVYTGQVVDTIYDIFW